MVNRLLSRLLMIAACVCAWAELAWAERKVAIVIGNSSYEHSQPLKNPVNDTKAVSDLFKQLGYEVQLHLDVDRAGFTQALGDFHQVATSADAAIFYYAGHGVSVDGRNYLVPVDSDIQRLTDVKLGLAIDAELAIEQALADAKVKLVFLDACRDNPFVEQIKRSLGATRSTAVSSGLAEMKSGAGTLIAFSTAPGQVAMDGDGENSPFAEALIKHLSEPGLEIRLAMTKVRADVETNTSGKQTPWESTNLTGFYYFNKSSILQDEQPPKTADQQMASDGEIEFWKSVKDSNNEELLRSYLKQFPGGLFRPIAQQIIETIEERRSIDAQSPANKSNISKSFEEQSPSKTSSDTDPEQKSSDGKKTSPGPKAKTPENKLAKTAVEETKGTTNGKPSKKASVARKEVKKRDGGTDKVTYQSRWSSGWGFVAPTGAMIRAAGHPTKLIITYRGKQYRCDIQTTRICRPP